MNLVDYVAPSRWYFFAVDNLWRRNLYNMLTKSPQHQESGTWMKQVMKALKKESTKEGDKNAACGVTMSSPEPTFHMRQCVGVVAYYCGRHVYS